MNQGCHRIVFSKCRGQPMVVAETAYSAGKAPATCRTPRRRSGPRRLVLAAAIAGLGLSMEDSTAQIVAYRSAPGSQRATVLDAGNGVPLVNIQTPSAAGVSRNTYSQFDVQEGGAILNNSRKGAQTQLAGQVAGNPWLAKGTAKVILNEVVSGNPSQLRGVIEVGGDRAEVVIANPAGIDVDGGGFINASRATLTTGTATVSNGSLQGYEVRQGTITVQGRGLDASQTDYAAVLARAVRINGAIHAKELKVIAGANRISADHQQVTPIAGTGAAPAFAVDVSALGGMYAGKITLIGTEAGVGVRNAGTVAASAGEVVITADGRLENTGQIISHADAAIDAAGGIGNSGTLYARGSIRLSTRRGIDNSGLIGAQANATLEAPGETGEILSRPGSILVAGLVPDGSFAPGGDLSLGAGRRIQLSGTNRAGNRIDAESPSISLGGSQTTGRFVHLEAIPNSRRPRSRRDPVTATTAGGAVDLSGATLVAEEEFTVLGDGVLRTDGARIVSAHLDLEAPSLSNRGGQVHQTGRAPLELDFPGGVDNSQGSLSANASLSLRTGSLSNDGGSIQSTGTLTVSSNGHLDNGTGRLVGGGGTSVQAGSLSNRGLIAGSVGSHGDLDNAGQITGDAQAGGTLGNSGVIGGHAAGADLNNSGLIAGNAQAGRDLRNSGGIAGHAFAAGRLSNGGGIGGAALAGTDLENAGTIHGDALAQGNLGNAGHISGLAFAGRQLDNTGDISMGASANGDLGNAGRIGGAASAGGSLGNQGTIAGPARAGNHLNNSGAIDGDALAGGNLNNAGHIAGTAQAAGSLGNTGGIAGSASAGAHLSNSGAIAGSAIAGSQLNNSGTIGGSASAGARLDNAGRIGGSAMAGDSMGNSGQIGGSAQAGNVIDNSGTIGSGGGAVSVSARQVVNTGAIGNGGGQVIVSAGSFDNDGGQVSGRQIGIQAAQVSNAQGSIQAGDRLQLVSQGTLDNTGGIMAAGGTAIIADGGSAADRTLNIVNTGGRLTAGRSLVVSGAGLSFDGQVASQGDFSAALSGDYTYTPGQDFFQANGAVSLSFTGTVTNHERWHVDGGLRVSGGQVVNTGEISSNGLTLVQASGGTLANQGLIQGDRVVVGGGALDNYSGQILGNTLYADFSGHADNTGGRIDIAGAAQIQVGGNLDNTAGRIDTGGLQLRVGGDLTNQTLPGTTSQQRLQNWSSAGLTQGIASEGSTGSRAGITARGGDLNLFVGGNLHLTGAELTAAGHLDGLVLGDIQVGNLNLVSQSHTVTTSGYGDFGDGGGSGLSASSSRLERTDRPIVSTLTAGGKLSLIAGGNAGYQGLDITAGSDLTLGAVTGDLTVTASIGAHEIHEVANTGNGSLTTWDEVTTTGIGGQLTAGGDIRLLAGHDLQLRGVNAATNGGTLTVSAGHGIDAAGQATGTAAVRVEQTPLAGDEYSLPGVQQRVDGDLRVEYHGGRFTAQGDIVFDAGHGNPFGSPYVAGIRQARTGAGLDADAVAPEATLGNLRLSGLDLISGSAGQRHDITLAAAGHVTLTGTRDSVATRRSPEANPYAGWVGPAEAAESVITLTPGVDHGQFQGRTLRIHADHGDVQLVGLRADAVTDLLTRSGGNTVIDSSQLTAGRDMSIHAQGELRIDGLVANPGIAPPRADTLNSHAIPTSAQATLTAGRDLNLTGVEGVTARGFALQGRDIVVSTLGDLTLAGGHLLESWSGRNERHERDTAVAGTIQGRTFTAQALGEQSDIHLSHLDVSTSGSTQLRATGDISIDPGADYAYDHWTESHSSGFIVEKTTTTDHVRESLTIRPSTFQVGGFDLQAGGDLTLTATVIDSQGTPSLRAGGDIQYLAAHHTRYSQDESHTSRGFLNPFTFTFCTYSNSSTSHTERSSTAFVTNIQSQADVLSQSDGSTTLEGTHIVSATGKVQILAGQDLNILPAQNSHHIEDTYQEWSLVSGGFNPQVNHRIKDSRTQTDTTLASADISGDTVVLVTGGNAHLVAAAIRGHEGTTLLAGGTILVEAGLETHLSSHDRQESGTGAYTNKVGGRYHGTVVGPIKQTEAQTGSTIIPVGSIIGSGHGDITVIGSQGTALFGSTLTAHGDIHLGSDQDILLGGSLSQHRGSSSAQTSTVVFKVRDGYEDQWQTDTVQAGTLTAGGRVILAAPEGSVTLGAVNIKSDGATEFQTPELNFVTEKNSDYFSHTAWDKDRGYEINWGNGRIDETLVLTHIDAQGGLVLPGTTQVSVALDGRLANANTGQPSAADLRRLALSLSTQPELGWLKTLADRPDIDWQAIQTAHQHWDYKSQGLTREGAIVLAFVVTVVTWGSGSAALGTTTTAEGGAAAGAAAGGTAGATAAGTAAGSTAVSTTTWGGLTLSTTAGGITTYTAAGSAINAGFTTLASNAAVSFANSGGNLGRTLQDLGSSSNVKQILASMLSGGVGGYFNGTYSLESLLGKTIAGCAATELSGGRCQDGATTALVIGGLSWAGHEFRQNTIANSSQFKGICLGETDQCENNLTKPSVGVNGDNLGMGGGRWDVVRICSTDGFSCTVDASGFVRVTGHGVENLTNTLPSQALEDVFQQHGSSLLSPMGGLQGGGGYLKVFGIGPGFYAKGSFWDKWVVEPFSGTHDQFNSSTTYDMVSDPTYQATRADFQGNPIDGQALAPRFVGNIQPMSNSEKWLSATMNVIDIPLAFPFAAATVSSQLPPGTIGLLSATWRNAGETHIPSRPAGP
jgi:filamentous hemagglutinin